MLQLNPTIPVTTPLGKAFAFILIDYSQEHDLLWVCFQQDTGESRTWSNKQIRLQENQSLGRDLPKVFANLLPTPPDATSVLVVTKLMNRLVSLDGELKSIPYRIGLEYLAAYGSDNSEMNPALRNHVHELIAEVEKENLERTES